MLLDTLAYVGVGVGSDTLSAGDIGSTHKHSSLLPQCPFSVVIFHLR